MVRFVALLVCETFSSVIATSLRAAHQDGTLNGYSFTQFVRDFGREYANPEEYRVRASHFEASLLESRLRQAKNVQARLSWTVGVHPFMDMTKAERSVMHGYKPSRTRVAGFQPLSALQTVARGMSMLNSSMVSSDSFGGASLAIRNQGNCGSCWAVSSAEAIEAQLHRNGADPSVRVSPQALVDCVPNPQHCGGKGGCDGATGELAFKYVRDHGIPLESELPYNAHTNACEAGSLDGAWPSSQRVRISGWTSLPSNKVDPVKQALVDQGPVVVAVDANDWFDYNNGIYDGCSKDAILGHAVLLKEYGSDGGKQYWRIQNSWGENWGENGHIRLAMHDDEESWCGTDSKPEEGSGCDGGPPTVQVCGTCGLLFDAVVPEGARIESGGSGTQTQPIFHPADTDAATASSDNDDSEEMRSLLESA